MNNRKSLKMQNGLLKNEDKEQTIKLTYFGIFCVLPNASQTDRQLNNCFSLRKNNAVCSVFFSLS